MDSKQQEELHSCKIVLVQYVVQRLSGSHKMSLRSLAHAYTIPWHYHRTTYLCVDIARFFSQSQEASRDGIDEMKDAALNHIQVILAVLFIEQSCVDHAIQQRPTSVYTFEKDIEKLPSTLSVWIARTGF